MTPPDPRRRPRVANLALGLAALALFVAIIGTIVGPLGEARIDAVQAAELEDQANRLEAQAARLERIVTRLDVDARAQCERTQVNRELVNRVSAAAFLAISGAQANAENAGERGDYRRIADAMFYAPPTNCARAVDKPGSYLRPHDVAFRALDTSDVLTILIHGRLDPRP